MQLNPSDLNFVAAGLRLLVEKQKKKRYKCAYTLDLLKRVEDEILKNWQETKL